MEMKKKVAVIVIIVVLIANIVSHAKVGMLARFADDVILENLEVGRSYNLRKKGNLPYKVTNIGDETTVILVEVQIPPEDWLKPDYEPIPDPSWIQIVPNKFKLAPNESGICEVVISIPDDKVWANRSYQFHIWSHLVRTGFMSTGTRHRLRFSTGIGPETVQKEKKKKGMLSLRLDFKPQSIYLNDVELDKKISLKKIKKSLKIINWSEDTAKLKISSIDYMKDLSLPPGYVAAPDPGWVSIKYRKVNLKGNMIKNLDISLKIPRHEIHFGKKYAFLIKAELVDIEVPLELFARIYIKIKGYEEK